MLDIFLLENMEHICLNCETLFCYHDILFGIGCLEQSTWSLGSGGCDIKS